MKTILSGALGLALLASSGLATAHPAAAARGCCAQGTQAQAPTYRAYDDGRSDYRPAPDRYAPQPTYSYEYAAPCCEEDVRVPDRYGPAPSPRYSDYGSRDLRVRSYGGAEQHYGACRDRRTQQVCDCDDDYAEDYVVVSRGRTYESGGGYSRSGAMNLGSEFFYDGGSVGPIPDSGYVGGGGGYAVMGGGGGSSSSFSSANATASAYSSSNTSITFGGRGGGHPGMGGHGGGKGGHGGGHPGMDGHGGMGGYGSGHPGMGGHGGYGGGKGGHGGMGGGKGGHGGMGGGD